MTPSNGTPTAVDLYGRLPAAMDLGQRLAIEGALIACRIIEAEAEVIAESVKEISYRDGKIHLLEAVKFRMFRASWSVVDRLDQLRQFLNFEGQYINFLLNKVDDDCLASARDLRNGMDHTLGNIAKLTKNGKNHFPIYGYLTFDYMTPDCFVEVEGFKRIAKRHVVMLSISSIHVPWKSTLEKQLPRSIQLPFGNFILSAFNSQVSISHAIILSRRIQAHISTVVAHRIFAEFGEDFDVVNGPAHGLITETFDAPFVPQTGHIA